MSRFNPTLNRYVEIGTTYDVSGNPEGKAYSEALYRNGQMPISFSNRKVNGKYRSGLTWLMWKVEQTTNPSAAVTTKNSGGTGKRSYSGSFSNEETAWRENPAIQTGRFRDGTLINDIGSVEAALSSRGSEAFNRMRPDLPSFDGAQEIGELKDLSGMYKSMVKDIKNAMTRHANRKANPGTKIRTNNKRRPADVGNFHLAVQFGWLPIVRSIQSYITAQRGLQKRLAQSIRDEGRNIRRRTVLPGGVNDTTTKIEFHNPTWRVMHPMLYYMSYNYGNRIWWSKLKQEYRTRSWAVASFRYLLPPGPRDVQWTSRMNRRLMGYYVTPSTVWNLMPWSWLADYFGTAGDFLQATSEGAFDSLVMNYGYMMTTQEQVTTAEQNQWVNLDAGGDYEVAAGEVVASTVTRAVIKVRIVGTPFGFGVKQGDLSAHQLGILGALGLSKL